MTLLGLLIRNSIDVQGTSTYPGPSDFVFEQRKRKPYMGQRQ